MANNREFLQSKGSENLMLLSSKFGAESEIMATPEMIWPAIMSSPDLFYLL